MKYVLIELLLISFLLSFDMDQWTHFKKVGPIHSIIEDDELVHFISSNGIYSYNDIEDNYYYNYNLSNQIDFNNKIDHFYFDSNTGVYWLVDKYGIRMKHSFLYFFSLLGLVMGIIGDFMYSVIDPRIDFESRE